MATFIGSVIVLLAMIGVVRVVGKRRAVDAELSWGEAMFAAVYVFFVMFWAYGVVPSSWLGLADNELKWRPDRYELGPASKMHWPILQNVPANVSAQTFRDIIVVGIYVVLLVGHVALWSWWQGRGEAAQKKQKAIEEATTTFGRPLVKSS